MKTKNKNLKPAYVENIIVWLVIFVGFVTMFFFTINFASILRVKDNMDAISDYGANMVSVNGVDVDMIEQLNDIALPLVSQIDAADLVCNSVVDNAYQVLFITETTNTEYKFYEEKFTTQRIVFNQVNANSVTCTLTITLED